MKVTIHVFGAALLGSILCDPSAAQIVLNQNQSPATLVQNILLGPGVGVDAATFNGSPGVASTGVGPSEIGRFSGMNTVLGMDGIFLCTGVAAVHIPGPNDQLSQEGGGISMAQGFQTPDRDLSQLTGWPNWELGNNICNKAVLEFDFVPDNDMMSFRYVFSSEEYERWVCSRYNDVFGWFISGPGITGPFDGNAMNIAFIPGSLAPVCINAVNNGQMNDANANGPDPLNDPFAPCFAADSDWQANAQYYRYNGGQWSTPQPFTTTPQLEAPYNNDPYYIQHNGLTVMLTANAAVEVGQQYHMKMAVANVNDSWFPSAVFIEQNSFRASDRFTLTVEPSPNVDNSGTTPVLHQSDILEARLRIDRWGGFYLDEDVLISVEGDAVAGVDYQPALPESVHFDQLDSAAVIHLQLPAGNDPSELIVKLTTGTGQKVQSFPLSIVQETTVGLKATDPRPRLSIFPNPADRTLYVDLPADLQQGTVQLELLDVAGRVVRTQRLHSTTRATVDLGDLPEGLYSLKATTQSQVVSGRVNVRH
jgi:hypothetical protein